MNTSEVAAGRPIEPDDAIKQIAYIRDLLESTKLRLASAYSLFVMWGVFWVIGYTSNHLLDIGGPEWLEWTWVVLNATGAVGTFVWLERYRRRATRATTTLERQIFWLMVALFVGFVALPLAIGGGTIALDLDAYIPFCI